MAQTSCERRVRRFRASGSVAAVLAALVGATVLAGWVANAPSLGSVAPNSVGMKANTAFAFLLIGISLLLQGRDAPRSRWRTLVGRGCGALVALLGLLTLGEYVCGWELGIDQFLFKTPPEADQPVRMSFNSALAFVLSGLALLTLDTAPRRGFFLPQNLALVVGCMGLSAMACHLYGVSSLQAFHSKFTVMTAGTACTFAVVSAGITCARPTAGWMRLATDDGLGGVIVRRLVVALALVQLLLGWLRLEGERSGIFPAEVGTAWFTAFRVVLVSAVVFAVARLVQRVEAVRDEAREGLRRLNADLERTVAARTAELRAAHHGLAAERDFVNAVLEVLGALVVVLDRDGRIVRFNRTCEKTTGFTFEEVRGQPLWDMLLAPEEKGPVRGVFERLRAGDFPLEYENHWMTKDGGRRLIAWSNTCVAAPDGAIAYLIGTGLDITDRRRTEEQARQRLQMLTALHAVTRELSETLELKGLAEHVVKACVEGFGAKVAWLSTVEADARIRVISHYPPGIPYPSRITARWDDTPEGRGPAGTAIRSGQPIVVDDLTRDTPYIPWRSDAVAEGHLCTAAFPLVTRGRPCGALCLCGDRPGFFTAERIEFFQTYANQAAAALENARLFDEVQRHAAELEKRVAERTADLEASNREIESFSYSVSHDLRAPLRSIDGFSQILLEDCAENLNDQGRDCLGRIRGGAKRMGALIDDLLKLSRINRGEMRTEPVDLSALAEALLAELRQQAPSREVECVVAKKMAARGDPQLLRVALQNLLDNAWKFTGNQPHGRIEFGALQDEGRRVFFVRDNGAGFDMAYSNRLFGAFQRLHSTNEFPGTGIGLATVERIIRRHGGRIWAEGEVGKGAAFYFTLQEGKPWTAG